MHLDDESRGNLVGAFIVEEGDEVMSITQSGQVVRTEVDESLRPLGRATKGVAFVRLRNGDAVAVVARSVEGKVVEEEPLEGATTADSAEGAAAEETTVESQDAVPDATIEGSQADETADPADEEGTQED
jgi:DNA gyrase subunit A